MRVLGVIINLFFPGIGTLIVGKIASGIVQLILLAVAGLFSITGVGVVVGVPLALVVWIWALVSAATAKEKPVQVVVVEKHIEKPPDKPAS